MPSLAIFNIIQEGPSCIIRKRNIDIQVEKEEMKTFLFTDKIINYLLYSIQSTKMLVITNKWFYHNGRTEKSIFPNYIFHSNKERTRNWRFENRVYNSIKICFLEINLTTYVQDLYLKIKHCRWKL